MMRHVRALCAAAVATVTGLGFAVTPAQAAPYPKKCETERGAAYIWPLTDHVDAYGIADDSLYPGYVCQINKSMLKMQGDGNLVLYDENGRARWAANWSRPQVIGRGYRAYMQTDGNFVLYDRAGQWQWQSDTDNPYGGTLAVQSDGNLVIYRSGNPVWRTGTEH